MKNQNTIFIVNPNANQGRLIKEWPAISEQIKSRFKNYEILITEASGHAEKLTRAYVKDNVHQIVAVGGDGTLNECLNGFFENSKLISPQTCLGVLPLGRGNDFARFLKIPTDIEDSLQLILNPKTRPIDIGKISCFGLRGNKLSRYFINIANVGIVGHVVNWCHKAPKILGAAGSYLYGCLRAAMEYRSKNVIIESPKRNIEQRIYNIVIANGRYFGSNMKIAPHAKVDDGLLDILVIKPVPAFQFLKNIPKIYSGDHIKLKEVESFKTKKITINPESFKNYPLVEADGDVIGRIPATVEICENKILFKANIK